MQSVEYTEKGIRKIEVIKAFLPDTSKLVLKKQKLTCRFEEFINLSKARWHELNLESPPEHLEALHPHGYYICAFEIKGIHEPLHLSRLKSIMEEITNPLYAWAPPFYLIPGTGKMPQIYRKGAHRKQDRDFTYESKDIDFWRAHCNRMMYIQRPYMEDSKEARKGLIPKKRLDYKQLMCNIGEIIDYIGHFQRALGTKEGVNLYLYFNGLKDRTLGTYNTYDQFVNLSNQEVRGDDADDIEIKMSYHFDNCHYDLIAKIFQTFYKKAGYKFSKTEIAQQLNKYYL